MLKIDLKEQEKAELENLDTHLERNLRNLDYIDRIDRMIAAIFSAATFYVKLLVLQKFSPPKIVLQLF